MSESKTFKKTSRRSGRRCNCIRCETDRHFKSVRKNKVDKEEILDELVETAQQENTGDGNE